MYTSEGVGTVTVIVGDVIIKNPLAMGPTTTETPRHGVSDITWRNKCHQLLSFVSKHG